MRKLKLDLDALEVESFDTRRTAERVGTVRANDESDDLFFDGDSLNVCYGGGANTAGTCIGPTYCCPVSWKASCYPTQNCGDTCGASCGSCAVSCPASCPDYDCSV